MLNNPSMTRSTHSQVSIREQSIPSGYLTTSASCSGGVAQLCSSGGGGASEHNMIYSQVGGSTNKRCVMSDLDMIDCQYGGGAGANATSSMPAFQRQLNVNTSAEFDNYSQVLSDDYDEEEVMNYGDIDVTNQHHHHYHHQQTHVAHGCSGSGPSRYQHADALSLPYSLKTSTQHGSILASSNTAAGAGAGASAGGAGGHVYANTSQQSGGSDNSLKNMYRAVEYKKGEKSSLSKF